ncbi:hypothetical protein ABZP36_013926 [Zizania latifolia]
MASYRPYAPQPQGGFPPQPPSMNLYGQRPQQPGYGHMPPQGRPCRSTRRRRRRTMASYRPYTPRPQRGFLPQPPLMNLLDSFAQFGVVFLLFALGLEFSLTKVAWIVQWKAVKRITRGHQENNREELLPLQLKK